MAVGGALARTPKSRPRNRILGMANDAGLTAIDIVYVARRRIAPVYLLDAVAELAIIGGWLAAATGAGRLLERPIPAFIREAMREEESMRAINGRWPNHEDKRFAYSY